MLRIAAARTSKAWQVIKRNSVLRKFSSAQKTKLQSVFKFKTYPANTILWDIGKPVKNSFLVASGSVVFEEMEQELEEPFCTGAFLCDIASMMNQKITHDELFFGHFRVDYVDFQLIMGFW